MLNVANMGLQSCGALKKLAGGLRINGQAPAEPAAAARPTARKTENPSETAAAAEAQNKAATARFAETFLKRLLADKDNHKTPEEAEALRDEVVKTIGEIKKQFGQPAANQVMAEILTNTERRMSAENIAQAVGGVLKSLAAANQAVMAKPDVTEEENAAARETEKKLQALLEFLNAPEEDDNGSGEPAGSGLTSALNRYFAIPGLEPKAGENKKFDADFVWRTETDIEASGAGNGAEFTLSVAEFGRENLAGLVDFLRNHLEDEAAAKIIENLGDDDDIFEAVEKVRDLFLRDVQKVKGVRPSPAESAPLMEKHFRGEALTEKEQATLDAIPNLGTPYVYKGEGLEKLGQLNIYLNFYVKDAVNETIRTSPALQERLNACADAQFKAMNREQAENYALGGWPGTSFGGFGIGTLDENYDIQFRNQNGGVNFEFGAFSGPGLTAKEYEIEMVKGWAEFNQMLGDWHGQRAPGSGEAAYAQMMEQYQEMKTAYETGAPSRYKTLSEMALDAYLANKKTPPGSLADKTV